MNDKDQESNPHAQIGDDNNSTISLESVGVDFRPEVLDQVTKTIRNPSFYQFSRTQVRDGVIS